jgi:predicted Zn-dependent protease
MKTAADFEQAYAATDDLTVNAMRKLLISNGILTRDGKLNRETAARLGWTVKDREGTAPR